MINFLKSLFSKDKDRQQAQFVPASKSNEVQTKLGLFTYQEAFRIFSGKIPWSHPKSELKIIGVASIEEGKKGIDDFIKVTVNFKKWDLELRQKIAQSTLSKVNDKLISINQRPFTKEELVSKLQADEFIINPGYEMSLDYVGNFDIYNDDEILPAFNVICNNKGEIQEIEFVLLF